MKPTVDDYRKLIAKLGSALKLDNLTPDDDGLLILEIDGKLQLNLQFLEPAAKLLLFTEVLTLPPDAPASAYQSLLSANLFAQNTAGGFFAYEVQSHAVVYQLPLDYDSSMTAEELMQVCEDVLNFVQMWANRLKSAPEAPESAASATLVNSHLNTGIIRG